MGNEHGTKESTAGFSMERITRNDAIFREANDGIHDAAEEHVEDRDGDVLVPFICECADPNCTEIIRVTLEQYREVRSQPRLFLNVPGHQASAHGWAAAVSGQDGYIIVEKLGPAGELAEAFPATVHGAAPNPWPTPGNGSARLVARRGILEQSHPTLC